MNKNLLAFYLFGIFFFVYALGSFTKIPFGDCMGFVLEIEKEKFVFSTSTYAHFLFTNSLVFLKQIFSSVESKEIGRWFTIFFGASTVFLVFKCIHEITKNDFSSVIGSFVFGFGFSFWRNAEIVEIYTFNTFLVGSFVYFSLKYYNKRQIRFFYLASIILGISLWNHIQNILLIPGFLYLVFLSKNSKQRVNSILIFALFVLGLFAVPIIVGENPKTVFSSTKGHEIAFSDFFKKIGFTVFYLFYNFWFFVLFGLFGIWKMLKDDRRIAVFLLTLIIPVAGFSTFFEVSDRYVFFLPAYFVFVIFIGFGIFKCLNFRFAKYVSLTALVIPIFYLATYQISLLTNQGKKFDNDKDFKGGISYYTLPWLNNNIGIIETFMENRVTKENIDWMRNSVNGYIKIKQEKGLSKEEIKKH